MRTVRLGRQVVHFEAPESGRYHAPLLLLPGLYQSFGCWRPFTSLLAHRGWELYCLPRTTLDEDGEELITEDDDWQRCRAKVIEVASQIGDRVILLGADLGAGLALSVVNEVNPLALALFSPCAPAQLGTAQAKPRGGFFSRLRGGADNSELTPVASPTLLDEKTDPDHLLPEPLPLLRDLPTCELNVPRDHAPTIVFNSSNDPLVPQGAPQDFLNHERARTAKTGLNGHWWPAQPASVSVADEVHRFLILTLGDRIVEFPDEILEPGDS